VLLITVDCHGEYKEDKMLPLVPRIPMFGGKLAAKKKAEFASVTNNQHQSSKRYNDYRSRQLMYGGPVQRAIRADLLSLRQEFQKDLEEVWSPPSAQNAVAKRAPGRAFQIFKETFRRTKFGIIHTRCSPPRCDKEAYIQMIFSAVLDLLCAEYHENLRNPSLENETSKKCFVDRVFAVFALYALYETNPLPNFPLNINILQKKSCDNLTASELKQILSMMPMGASSDQGGRRAFRRYFRAPIRISLDQYHSLIQLRDVSMAIMDLLSCQQLSFISDMAIDCVYLIDRLKESSLLLCEYAGPSSLEGLIGSEEYYHSVVLNENEKHATTSLDTTLVSSDLLTGQQIHEDIDEVLSISSFEELIATHQQQYDRILGSISLDINRYKSNSRPSLKLNSIESILKDIIQGRHQSQNRSNSSTIRQKLQNALLRHSVQASDSRVNDYNKDQESLTC
jgi:Small nuclear RNA activating complex (SNAPc), subunit SNAP43.